MRYAIAKHKTRQPLNVSTRFDSLLVMSTVQFIYRYPKANTGGCTKQACSFNENADKLAKAGYQIFGLSADKPKSQANWKQKHNLTFTLLSDPSQEVRPGP